MLSLLESLKVKCKELDNSSTKVKWGEDKNFIIYIKSLKDEIGRRWNVSWKFVVKCKKSKRIWMIAAIRGISPVAQHTWLGNEGVNVNMGKRTL